MNALEHSKVRLPFFLYTLYIYTSLLGTVAQNLLLSFRSSSMVARIGGMLNYFLVRLVDKKKMGALKVYRGSSRGEIGAGRSLHLVWI